MSDSPVRLLDQPQEDTLEDLQRAIAILVLSQTDHDLGCRGAHAGTQEGAR